MTLEGLQRFRYEGGDLNYEPPASAPAGWDGNLADLIGDYFAAADVEALLASTCPHPSGTGKQSPAEPQGEASKVDAPQSESTSTPDSCPEPQGDVVEKLRAVAKQLWRDSQRDTTKIRDAGYMQDAAQAIEDLTPLIHLEVKERLLDELEKARQGHVRPGCIVGDLFGNLQDKDHAKADLAERRVISGVQVVALADVNTAIDATLAPVSSEPEEGKDA